MRILVTGASGYIGARFVAMARSQGHAVVVATRRPSAGRDEIFFDLASPSGTTVPAGIDAVIHLAANTATNAGVACDEVAAAEALLRAALDRDARFLFVSSQTARADAPTDYGRIKWEIEQRVLRAGGLVARPGQVFGGPELGLFRMLVTLVRKLPVLPAFVPAPMVQPIHVDDCARALLTLVERTDLRGRVFCLGSAPVPFTTFLRAIAQRRLRATRVFVPVPVFLVRIAMGVLGASRATRLGLSGLTSLFDLRAMACDADLAELGIVLRPLDDGMNRSAHGRRRALIEEARALLAYVLDDDPGTALALRYVRAIEALRGGGPLPIPRWVPRMPWTVALLERRADPSPFDLELAWRIDAASTLAEATPRGATRYLGDARTRHSGRAVWRLSAALAGEFAIRVLRIIVAPAVRAAHPRAVR